MDLKYIMKNDKYIIDRRCDYSDEAREANTYKMNGKMVINDMLPSDNEKSAKLVAEYILDNMKKSALDKIKKEYYIHDNEIINFYFEGDIEKDYDKVYIKFKDKQLPVNHVEFKLDFEVELKVTPKNFFKIKYDILKFKLNNLKMTS